MGSTWYEMKSRVSTACMSQTKCKIWTYIACVSEKMLGRNTQNINKGLLHNGTRMNKFSSVFYSLFQSFDNK